jgi:hypothetical protein
MKSILVITLSLLALIFTESFAQADATLESSFRSYVADLQVSNGEVKSIELQVTPRLAVTSYGDPEIPHHGHHDYLVTGKVVESGKSCKFELLLAQEGGTRMSDEELLKARLDHAGAISLCSGLMFEIASVRSLLTDESIVATLRANGLSRAIGKGTATFQGIKTLTDEHDGCADPYHCPPHFIGPRR